jgi:hypothetical protein
MKGTEEREWSRAVERGGKSIMELFVSNIFHTFIKSGNFLS